MNQQDFKQYRRMGLGYTIGGTLIVATLIGVGLGWLVDRRFHTSPWGVGIGVIVGAAAGFLEMFKILSQEDND